MLKCLGSSVKFYAYYIYNKIVIKRNNEMKDSFVFLMKFKNTCKTQVN